MKQLLIKYMIIFVAGFGFVSCDDDDEVLPETYNVNFGALNDSGVSGTAIITIEGNVMTVSIDATGLEASQMHPQHIHGLDNASENATCPPMEADTNQDGMISVEEGMPFYGGIILPLEPFPTAAADGTLLYQESFTLGEGDMPTLDELRPFENRVIVLHGMTVNGTYQATLPVACGQLIQ
ncbi:MAG: hypothetical protein ACNS60_17055 [Candidatus Cyclobacteriaceae bacterium M2_1C_046]